MKTSESNQLTTEVTGHGIVEVTLGYDDDRNPRIYPHGASTQQEWAANPTRLPPWLLPSDLVGGRDEYQRLIALVPSADCPEYPDDYYDLPGDGEYYDYIA